MPSKKKAEPFRIAGRDFYPTPNYCRWCGETHWGLCPNSIGPTMEAFRIKIEELEALVQFVHRENKKHEEEIEHLRTIVQRRRGILGTLCQNVSRLFTRASAAHAHAYTSELHDPHE